MISQNSGYKEAVKKNIDSTPFIQYLGLELKDIGPGWCEIEILIKDHHLQQDNFIHAGVLATLADHTAGMAALSLLPANQIVLTIEFKINFLRPAFGDALRCMATVLKYGKSITVTESEVYAVNSGEEKLVAKASVTLANVTQNDLPDGNSSHTSAPDFQL